MRYPLSDEFSERFAIVSRTGTLFFNGVPLTTKCCVPVYPIGDVAQAQSVRVRTCKHTRISAMVAHFGFLSAIFVRNSRCLKASLQISSNTKEIALRRDDRRSGSTGQFTKLCARPYCFEPKEVAMSGSRGRTWNVSCTHCKIKCGEGRSYANTITHPYALEKIWTCLKSVNRE